jgi:hypothetical protein
MYKRATGKVLKKAQYLEERDIEHKQEYKSTRVRSTYVEGQGRPKDYACCSERTLSKQEKTLLAYKGDSAVVR